MDKRDSQLLRMQVQARFGEVAYTIDDEIGVLWRGWEMDSTVTVIRLRDGSRHLVIEDGVNTEQTEEAIRAMLRERVDAYRKAVGDTEAFLDRWDAGM